MMMRTSDCSRICGFRWHKLVKNHTLQKTYKPYRRRFFKQRKWDGSHLVFDMATMYLAAPPNALTICTYERWHMWTRRPISPTVPYRGPRSVGYAVALLLLYICHIQKDQMFYVAERRRLSDDIFISVGVVWNVKPLFSGAFRVVPNAADNWFVMYVTLVCAAGPAPEAVHAELLTLRK